MAQTLFDEYDADKNGVVTKEEMTCKEEDDFTLMQSDKETKVAKKEMILFSKHFERLDSNSDGCVTQQEFQKRKFPFE